MNKSNLLSISLLLWTSFVVFACSGGTNTPNSPFQTPAPTPTPTEEERKAKSEQETVDKSKALADFVATNHKSWELQGISAGFSGTCQADEPCELHLIKGKENKVVTVIIRKFHKSDGTEYWYVHEATKLDLARLKIIELKEAAVEEGREEGKEMAAEEVAQAEYAHEEQDYDPY